MNMICLNHTLLGVPISNYDLMHLKYVYESITCFPCPSSVYEVTDTRIMIFKCHVPLHYKYVNYSGHSFFIPSKR